MTDESSAVAEPGEMITYGRWMRKPATTITAISTPTVDSTAATSVCLRLRVGVGSSGGGGSAGADMWSVIRLRSGAGSLALRPGSTRTESTRSRALDGYAHPAACHAAHAVRRALGADAGDARRPARHRVRTDAPAHRGNRHPGGRRARHRVRGSRHRDQRPTAVNDAGPVARAAELATLGHQAPLDRAAHDRLLAALTEDADPRVRAAALGALARAAPNNATAPWLRGLGDHAP